MHFFITGFLPNGYSSGARLTQGAVKVVAPILQLSGGVEMAQRGLIQAQINSLWAAILACLCRSPTFNSHFIICIYFPVIHT